MGLLVRDHEEYRCADEQARSSGFLQPLWCRLRRGKHPVLDDVAVDSFECLGQWGEKLPGETFEEEVTDQVDVAGRGFDDRSPALWSQLDFGCPPVLGCEVGVD